MILKSMFRIFLFIRIFCLCFRVAYIFKLFLAFNLVHPGGAPYRTVLGRRPPGADRKRHRQPQGPGRPLARLALHRRELKTGSAGGLLGILNSRRWSP